MEGEIWRIQPEIREKERLSVKRKNTLKDCVLWDSMTSRWCSPFECR
jgi:hypothetical protein